MIEEIHLQLSLISTTPHPTLRAGYAWHISDRLDDALYYKLNFSGEQVARIFDALKNQLLNEKDADVITALLSAIYHLIYLRRDTEIDLAEIVALYEGMNAEQKGYVLVIIGAAGQVQYKSLIYDALSDEIEFLRNEAWEAINEKAWKENIGAS